MRYLVLRLIAAGVVVLLVVTLVFYAVEVLPGDPTRLFLPKCGLCGTDPAARDLRNQLIHQWGLDKPILDRYVIFLSNIFTGNLGPSITTRPFTLVTDLIAPRLLTTLLLAGVSLLVAIVVGLVLGMPLSRRKGSLADSAVSLLLAVPFAIPVSALSLGMLSLLAFAVPVFPPFGAHSLNYLTMDPLGQLADYLWHLTLPLVVLTLALMGLFAWIVRDHPLEPSSSFERPSAPGDWRIPRTRLRTRIRATVPRFLPAVPALLGWAAAAVLTVDAAFDLGGLGTLLWNAVLNLDFPLLMGVVLVVSLVLVLPVLVLADLLHYALTASWVRSDRLTARRFRVDPHDLSRGFMRVLLHPLGFAGVVLALVLLGMTVAAPLLVGPFPTRTMAVQPLLPPSPDHPLGTDSRGFDVLALTLYGGQMGFAVAIAAFAIALIAELGVTAAVGFFGDRADVFVGIPVDLFLVLPLPFTLALGLTGSGISYVVFAGLVAWPVPARILRMELTHIVETPDSSTGEKPTLSERGLRTVNLIWGMGPVLLGDALLAVSLALSVWGVMGFFGFGTPGTSSWGGMLNEWFTSLGFLQGRWEGFLAPMLCLTAAVLAPMLLSLASKAIGPHAEPTRPQLIQIPTPLSATAALPPP